MSILRSVGRAFPTLAICLFPVGAAASSMLAPVPLGEFTSALYSYSLTIVGLGVFVMFLVAGLTKIVPSLQKSLGDPMQIIKDAVIGLIILASAYVILNSINPDLVKTGTQ